MMKASKVKILSILILVVIGTYSHIYGENGTELLTTTKRADHNLVLTETAVLLPSTVGDVDIRVRNEKGVSSRTLQQTNRGYNNDEGNSGIPAWVVMVIGVVGGIIVVVFCTYGISVFADIHCSTKPIISNSEHTETLGQGGEGQIRDETSSIVLEATVVLNSEATQQRDNNTPIAATWISLG